MLKYQTGSQVQAGLVPTRSGLLFAGDTHGNLLVLDAKTRPFANENRRQRCAEQRPDQLFGGRSTMAEAQQNGEEFANLPFELGRKNPAARAGFELV